MIERKPDPVVRACLIAIMILLAWIAWRPSATVAQAASFSEYKVRMVIPNQRETEATLQQVIKQNTTGLWRYVDSNVYYRPDNGQPIYVLVFGK